MKLVINTQICENYGAHDWDGEGECPQRWKFKGGSTFVVDNITPAQQTRIMRDGIPTLNSLIEEDNESFREYVIDYSVVDDDAPEGNEWEIPFRLTYARGEPVGRWIASRVIDNTNEYAYMRSEIKSKVEGYVMAPGNERVNYSASYELKNGTFCFTDDELRAALEKMKAA